MKILRKSLTLMLLLITCLVKAQVSVNVNIGSPPMWGPVGYSEVQYYYLPDVEAYYDVHSSMFIYYSGGSWIQRAHLPSMYSHYDLYSGYKVVIEDYRGSTPYVHFDRHKVKYAKGYRGSPQKTIGQKPGKGKGNSPQPRSGKVEQKHGKSASPGSGRHDSGGKKPGNKGNGKGHK